MPNRELDRRVLQELAAHGSDLSKPAHILHYFYFTSKHAALTVVDQLVNEGFENPNVSPARSSWWKRLLGLNEWSCVVETHAVPSEAAVFATTDRFNALAAAHGGIYDGWEASIEKA